MGKIPPGIYVPPTFSFLTRVPPTIVVHPYYDYDLKRLEARIPYEAGIEAFVRAHRGPIITFEEKRTLRVRAEQFLNWSPRGSLFFVETIQDNPKPRDFELKEFALFLERFHSHDIHLAGGYTRDSDSLGCLGTVEDALQSAGFRTELVPGLTYGLGDLRYRY